MRADMTWQGNYTDMPVEVHTHCHTHTYTHAACAALRVTIAALYYM